MSRIEALNPETATGKTKELFTAIQGKLGMVPNLMRTFGNSPAVLEGYLGFSGALGASAIGPKLGELLALTVANANGCEYCNAAHSLIANKIAGIPTDVIAAARRGEAADAKTQAALTFARTILNTRGNVSEADVQGLKEVGYTAAEIAEIIAHTALNIFTNYFNNAIKVELDFPEVPLEEVAAI